MSGGSGSIRGQFEELQTFNYTLTSNEITRQYDTVISQDRDLNGTPDLLEDAVLPAPRPFTGIPFAITGAIEAEQFDLGGPGVAYSTAGGNYWTNDYRPSAIEITNCNDLGLGYCVNNLRSNDWLKYTIDVRVEQNYVIEARIAALVTNGGAFIVSFTNFNGAITSTPPIVIVSTNWHEAVYRPIGLLRGTNIMTITIVSNAPASNVAAKFNYISLYPAFDPGATNIITNILISASALDTNESWFAATNNAGVIQKALNDLPPSTNGGGAITIPAGRWFVAQNEPDERLSYQANGAIYVFRSNTEIRGVGPYKTNTALIAWSRSTSPFVVGLRVFYDLIAVTNFTLRDISLEGRPHNRAATNSETGGFKWIWESGGMTQVGGEIGSLVTVASAIDVDLPTVFTNFTLNLLFTNCLFRNPSTYSIAAAPSWSNALVAGCEFMFRDTSFDSTNGVWPFPLAVSYATNTTREGPFGQVGVFTRTPRAFNTLVISNTFSGNPGITTANTIWDVDAADGLFWGQQGGNWFVARNFLTNHYFEGIALEGGPSAAVGNQYKSFVSIRAATAISARAGGPSVNGTTNDPQDHSFYFVGNAVDGGRHGELSQGSGNYRPYHLHFTGNSIKLLPGFQRADDVPSTAAWLNALAFGNLSGNTLLTGEQGIAWLDLCTNSLVIKNDFGTASGRALDYFGSNGVVRNVQIIKNVLNQGTSYHLKQRHPDSSAFFLQKNTYTNTHGGGLPLFDAAASPIHLMQ